MEKIPPEYGVQLLESVRAIASEVVALQWFAAAIVALLALILWRIW